MTLTFNSDHYQQLLLQYQPKPIKTEAENEKVLALVEELMHRSNRTPEETVLYELLITLVEKFEREFYQPSASTPQAMLTFLMDQQDLDRADLTDIFGSEANVSAVIEGEQDMTIAQARALGELFHVEPELFI